MTLTYLSLTYCAYPYLHLEQQNGAPLLLWARACTGFHLVISEKKSVKS